MSPADALAKAQQAGFTVTVEGGSLSLEPAEEPPPDVIEALRQHKSEIVALLLREPAVAPAEPRIVKQEPYGSASAPERYLDAWARLQSQCPAGIWEPQWRQAIDDAGRFLDEWGNLAATFGWSVRDLFFDVPKGGRMGLVWWLRGRKAVAVGPEHCIVERPGGPAYDRITGQDWVRQFVGSSAPCNSRV